MAFQKAQHVDARHAILYDVGGNQYINEFNLGCKDSDLEEKVVC